MSWVRIPNVSTKHKGGRVALTDNERMKKRAKPVRAVDAKTNRTWGDKQKIEAAQSYMLLGNMVLTSRITGIPEITLRVWKRSEWWKNLMDELKEQESLEMSSRLRKIVDASLTAVEDRIVNGDLVFDQKAGEMKRKPVNLKDAHKVAVDLMDKREKLEKATISGPTEQQDENKLDKLAERFAQFVNKKLEGKNTQIIDVEVKETGNALHEERETRLQDGIREIPLEAGTAEESVGADNPPQQSE
jgi:hypothetical protein